MRGFGLGNDLTEIGTCRVRIAEESAYSFTVSFLDRDRVPASSDC
jgi:hypothetical protein